jgi:hypothetical protein
LLVLQVWVKTFPPPPSYEITMGRNWKDDKYSVSGA